MKYKVGDKVRVRKDLVVGKAYPFKGCLFRDDMSKYLGKEVCIKIADAHSKIYGIEGSIRRWSDEMLEDVDEEFKLPEKWCIKVTTDNIKVVGKYYDREGAACYTDKHYIGSYYLSHNITSGVSVIDTGFGANFSANAIPGNHAEITFDQFKKYVMKSEATPVKAEVKFEKGKWYKGEPNDYYFKAAGGVEKSESWYNLVPVTEEIISGIHEVVSRYWSNDKYEKFALENPFDLSEIQQYLPEGHPDKINTLEQSRESLLKEAKRRYPLVPCETCEGFGTVMVPKLYPSGHIEVDEDCPDCGGLGEVESEYDEEPVSENSGRFSFMDLISNKPPFSFQASPNNESDFPIISTKRIINFSQLT